MEYGELKEKVIECAFPNVLKIMSILLILSKDDVFEFEGNEIRAGSHSLRASSDYRSDQSVIWDEISEKASRRDAVSPSMAMAEIYALDAIDWFDQEKEHKPLKSVTTDFMKSSRAAQIETHPSVGLVMDIRLEPCPTPIHKNSGIVATSPIMKGYMTACNIVRIKPLPAGAGRFLLGLKVGYFG